MRSTVKINLGMPYVFCAIKETLCSVYSHISICELLFASVEKDAGFQQKGHLLNTKFFNTKFFNMKNSTYFFSTENSPDTKCFQYEMNVQRRNLFFSKNLT